MTNRLAQETSPYLRQHQDNPVDWYPWGEEAFARARAENKPILLSIGYAACHWCHVMAHESFEDEATADFMNEHFVNVKVDREERPDVDRIYMDAVVAMTGQGGWPMTVALTPEGEPFFGGTYYPKTPRYGMPSFRQVLAGLVNAWQTRRGDVADQAAAVTEHIGRRMALDGSQDLLDDGLLAKARQTLARSFDADDGGFSGAPKFPPSMTLEFLLRLYRQQRDDYVRHMIEYTLRKMAFGGMYDQVGGGFARYSVDAQWLVPHFEKMLYDNALLSRVYLHAYQVTGDPLYRRIVTETLDWVSREMTAAEGGFFSSLDADSEGEEGKYYVWTPAEIEAVLGDEAAMAQRYFGVTERGNFEGHNILHVPQEPVVVAEALGLDEATLAARVGDWRRRLYAAREQRERPGLDDKVLTSWNGLMLASFAEAGRALGEPAYTATAVRNAQFLYQQMRAENGRLHRTWTAGGEAKLNGYLEDYAYLADGLLALYQTTFDVRWFDWAQELAQLMVAHFRDEAGGFFDTSDDHEQLIHRPKDLQDNATPSGNAMAVHVLLQLSLYLGDEHYWDLAEKSVTALYGAMAQYPTAFGHWLAAAAFILGEPRELAIVGDLGAPDTKALLAVVHETYRPNLVVAAGDERIGRSVPLLADRPLKDGQATAYLCRRFLCQAPVTEPEALAAQLAGS